MYSTELIPHQDFLFGEGSGTADFLGAAALTAVRVAMKTEPRSCLRLTLEDPVMKASVDGGEDVFMNGLAKNFVTRVLEANGLRIFGGNKVRLQIVVNVNKSQRCRGGGDGDKVQNLDRDQRRARIEQRALRLVEGY